MQFKLLQKVFVCLLTCLQLSRNQHPRCTTYTVNEKFIGSLHEDRTKPLWEIKNKSFGFFMHSCFSRCETDQRCVGIEICTIRPDLALCRWCCEWYVIDNDGGLPNNATDGCKYFELVRAIYFIFSSSLYRISIAGFRIMEFGFRITIYRSQNWYSFQKQTFSIKLWYSPQRLFTWISYILLFSRFSD